MIRIATRIGVATVAIALLFAAAADAEEAPAPSRAEYVAKLEGICKPRALATKRAVQGMRADLRAERLAIAAAKFSQASRFFAATVREISPLPRPLADRATLARWFRYLAQEESNLQQDRRRASRRPSRRLPARLGPVRYERRTRRQRRPRLWLQLLLLQAFALRIGECGEAPYFSSRPSHTQAGGPLRRGACRRRLPRRPRHPRRRQLVLSSAT